MVSNLLDAKFSMSSRDREVEGIFLAQHRLPGVGLRFDRFMRGSMLGSRSAASKLQSKLGKHQ